MSHWNPFGHLYPGQSLWTNVQLFLRQDDLIEGQFKTMANSPRRTVPMQVLLLSPPRTGTTSMKLALEELLQAPVWHGERLMLEKTKPPKFWLNIIEHKYEGKGHPYTRADFDVALGNFAALTDMPSCWLWRELMDAYPDAKVILVQRDFPSWWKSFDAAAISGGAFTRLTHLVVLLEPLLNSYVATMCQKVLLGYFDAKDKGEIIQNAEKVFERHYREIREKCAETPGRLLEMKIEDGWEPLCRFLGKEVPERSFPRTNEIQILQAKTAKFRRQQIQGAVLSAMGFALVPVVVGVAAYCYMR